MRYLRYNTAVMISVGPFVDYTDGVTPLTALTVTNCHLTMIKDDDDGTEPNLILDTTPTASGGNNDMVHITNDDDGFYSLELTTANTSNYGRVIISITDPDVHLPVWHEFMIVSQNFYDSMFGSDYLQVDTVQVEGADATNTIGTEVNTQVLDVLNTDTFAEPGQGAPPATATLQQKIAYLYKALINRATQNSTQLSIYNNAGDTIDQKATVSDNGTTFDRGKLISG